MPSKALADFKAEVAAQQEEIKPIIEGLEDYNRLNIAPETQQIVQTALADLKKRQQLLANSMKAITDLEGNNYPDLPTKIVTVAIYEDLAAQKKTIEAALGKFAPAEEATSATIVAGEPQPK